LLIADLKKSLVLLGSVNYPIFKSATGNRQSALLTLIADGLLFKPSVFALR
jgi:hypothetical protein